MFDCHLECLLFCKCIKLRRTLLQILMNDQTITLKNLFLCRVACLREDIFSFAKCSSLKKKPYMVEYSLSNLFNDPTISVCCPKSSKMSKQ